MSHPRRLDQERRCRIRSDVIRNIDIAYQVKCVNVDVASQATWSGTWRSHHRRFGRERGCRILGDLVGKVEVASQAT